ncbi:hypothetical protein COOONC_08253 [Cooperia oncophora]
MIVAWNTYAGATKTYTRKNLSMQETLLGTNILTTIFTLSSTVLPVVMLIMYGIIFLTIIKKRSGPTDAASSERDRSLLWQALAITVMLEINAFAAKDQMGEVAEPLIY